VHLTFREILVVIALFALLFGARRIPDLARSIGKALREFRKGIGGLSEGDNGGSGTDSSATGDAAAGEPDNGGRPERERGNGNDEPTPSR
jgi:sec-independent protein translocase protein TatA